MTAVDHEHTVRRWWLGPSLVTLNSAAFFWFALAVPPMALPLAAKIAIGAWAIISFAMTLCLPIVWAASTNVNPYIVDNVYCRRHAWHHSPRLGCRFCNDE